MSFLNVTASEDLHEISDVGFEILSLRKNYISFDLPGISQFSLAKTFQVIDTDINLNHIGSRFTIFLEIPESKKERAATIIRRILRSILQRHNVQSDEELTDYRFFISRYETLGFRGTVTFSLETKTICVCENKFELIQPKNQTLQFRRRFSDKL